MKVKPVLEKTDHIAVHVETTFVDKSKKGRITPNKSGSYRLPIAVLGIATRNNTYYDVKEFTEQLNSPNSHFNKKVSQGQMYGEWDHPNPDNVSGKTENEKQQNFLKRILKIDQDRISHHISAVSVEKNLESGGRLVEANIKPFGPFKDSLQDSLDTPSINTAFSLRALSKQRKEGGLIKRKMARLVTFDCVLSGGYEEASKGFSSALEGYSIPLDLSQASSDMINSSEISLESINDQELIDFLECESIQIKTETHHLNRDYINELFRTQTELL